MKAIILKQAGGVENLAIAEVPMPAPEKGEVLIKVNAISINPAKGRSLALGQNSYPHHEGHINNDEYKTA